MTTEHDEHNYFSIAAAVACLGEIAKEHDTDGLIRAVGYIDMTPTILLRGVAFLGDCLDACDNPPPMQARLARTAIREITALCATLMDFECDAEIHRAIRAQEGGAA